MDAPLRITRVGDSAAVLVPQDVLAHLRLEVGDRVLISKVERAIDQPDFETQMAVAREVMVRRRSALRELAK